MTKPNHQIDSLRALHQFATVELVTRNNNDCIEFQNKNCQDTYGCDEIYEGEQVSVTGYDAATFSATIYKLDAPRYLPYII